MTEAQAVLARDKKGKANKRRASRRNQAFGDVTINDIVLQRRKLTADVDEAVIDLDITRSIEEAAHIVLTIHDQQRVLKTAPIFTTKLRMTLDDREFVTVGRGKNQDDYTFTFESRAVNEMRKYKRYKKMRRGRVTRAQFAKSLVDEIPWLTFFCPELNKRQPIDRADDQASADKKQVERRKGIGPQRGLRVTTGDETYETSAVATQDQLDVLERVLDACDAGDYHPKAVLACVEAAMIENGASNSAVINDPGSTSVGVFQAQYGLSEGLNDKIITKEEALDIEYMVKCFMEDRAGGGFASKGGAMYLLKANPSWTAGQIAQGVEASGHPDRYDRAERAAREVIEAYGGAGSLSGSDSVTRKKPYEFSRGKPGEPEDTWTCLQRLAQEVQWYCFEVDNVVYFMSGDYLRRAKPILSIREDEPEVDWINWNDDEGMENAEATITCRATRWFAPPGSPVVIYDEGEGIDGKWIITSINRKGFDQNCTIQLHRPVKPLPEPANDTETISRNSDGGFNLTEGSLRDRILQVAEASRASYNREGARWFYSQEGSSVNQDPTRPPKPGTRSDCSLWVCDVYKKAGAPSPPGSSWTGFTGSMQATGRSVSLDDLKPGDLVLYGAGDAHHVELYVGPGDRTIGHGSPPVDYGTVGMQSGARGWTYDFLDNDD